MSTDVAPDAAVVEADNAVREAIAAAENAAVSTRGQQSVPPVVGQPGAPVRRRPSLAGALTR